jgi:hypothetical protein
MRETSFLSTSPTSRKLNDNIFKSALVSALGGLLFRFDAPVISSGSDSLSNKFINSPNLL